MGFGLDLIFSASSLVKPVEAVMVIFCSLFVALSFALTFRMPFRIDVKRDFDLRRPPRSRWNSVQLERAERPVVLRELPLALHDVDFHPRLVVRSVE